MNMGSVECGVTSVVHLLLIEPQRNRVKIDVSVEAAYPGGLVGVSSATVKFASTLRNNQILF